MVYSVPSVMVPFTVRLKMNSKNNSLSLSSKCKYLSRLMQPVPKLGYDVDEVKNNSPEMALTWH